MLDSVRCLMSAVAPTEDRRRRGASQREVRVHRVSSRFPALQVRTRMDSYGTGPTRDPGHGRDRRDRDGEGCGGGGGSRCSSSDSDSAKTTCSSVSDTDFYYVDRTDCRTVHTTVVRLRAEPVESVVQEEFEDSLTVVQDRAAPATTSLRHRHVLSESCRVKVQNLRCVPRRVCLSRPHAPVGATRRYSTGGAGERPSEKPLSSKRVYYQFE